MTGGSLIIIHVRTGKSRFAARRRLRNTTTLTYYHNCFALDTPIRDPAPPPTTSTHAPIRHFRRRRDASSKTSAFQHIRHPCNPTREALRRANGNRAGAATFSCFLLLLTLRLPGYATLSRLDLHHSPVFSHSPVSCLAVPLPFRRPPVCPPPTLPTRPLAPSIH